MTTRADLYRLIDDLPDEELDFARELLEPLVGCESHPQDLRAECEAFAREHEIPIDQVCAHPVLRALATAPVDDEPETEAEREAVAEARAAVARGEVVDNETLRREIGW